MYRDVFGITLTYLSQVSRVGQLLGLGYFANLMAAIVHQKFVGDCTFVPPVTIQMYLRLFTNPDADALHFFFTIAERLVLTLESQF